MAISLYDMSVPTYLQTLGAVSGFLEKGLAHCKECNAAPGEVVEHRLFQDMAPFSFQIRSVAHHSAGAMEALKSGAKDVMDMKREYIRRRRFMVESLNKVGLPCHQPQGAFYAYPNLGVALDAKGFIRTGSELGTKSTRAPRRLCS